MTRSHVNVPRITFEFVHRNGATNAIVHAGLPIAAASTSADIWIKSPRRV